MLSSEFKPETPLVEIMNPRDEGLYGWFTVNFLYGVFSSGSLASSVAALDLGGGSTQITFVPSIKPVAGLEGRKDFVHEVSLYIRGSAFRVTIAIKPSSPLADVALP